ncbi:MAG: hypothetical protein LLF90_05825 [Methanomicrobiaceae archaeon]|uniref:hypothetical protein n=1 Tax=Methanoculleus sp. TaxID=90427 RepID=UPI00320C097A|nr:hypothetical protein [Methanomicrobiaceae archaeon]
MQEPLKRADWVLPFGPGYSNPGPSKIARSSPTTPITRPGTCGTLPPTNQAINLGERYSLDPTHPEDIRYIPDITIEGD